MFHYQGLGKRSGNVYNLRGKYGNKEKSHDTLKQLLQIPMIKIWFMLQQIIFVLMSNFQRYLSFQTKAGSSLNKTMPFNFADNRKEVLRKDTY